MQFSSMEFLFCFMPLFLVVYFAAPMKLRGGVLLLSSILFYGLSCGDNYWYLALLLALTLLTYFIGRLMKKGRGWLLGLCLVDLAGILIFFKVYQGGKLLPPGISFYIFQMAAYLIAAYRGDIQPDRNLINYSAKTMMFPKLLSGPLVNPRALGQMTLENRYDTKRIHTGLQELILGLAMKVLLADRLAGVWSQAMVIGYESLSVAYVWLALLAYVMRLYFDFFGYSMMAVGLGRMIGLDLPRNFDNPYAARSVSEFYRRWHITLGAWFREFVYIPMGGNRHGTLRTILNLSVVWLLTGLWHGVGGNYLIWAGILLFFILNERLWLGKCLKKWRIFSHVYTVFVILLSWVPFAVGRFDQMVLFFGRLFGQMGEVLNHSDYLRILDTYWPFLAAGLVLATPFPEKLWKKIRNHPPADILIIALFWGAVYCIATAEQSPFLYFSF